MAALIRTQLQSLFDQATVDSSHAGLLLQRKLPEYEGTGEKPLKSKLIDTITSVQPSRLYELAFERWLKFTGTRLSTVATIVATVDGRLITGLNTGGSLETGVITHHTYGLPMIAGSSVKGAVRQYAEAIRLDSKYLAILFGHGDDDSPHDGEENLLNDTAGYLIWHDAWWIPQTSMQKPFVKEIVTVHHQEYYIGAQTEATDFDSPVPNQQVAVQGSFYFAIEGEKQWVDFAKQLLENMLCQNGLGAKASSGYGYFKINKQLSAKLTQQLKQLEALEENQRKDKELKVTLLGLSENQRFIKKFEANLPDQKSWENKPSQEVSVHIDGQKYTFLKIFKLIENWDDIEDLKYAIAFFEKKLKIWSGKPLNQNKPWKDRINPLKRRAGLIQ